MLAGLASGVTQVYSSESLECCPSLPWQVAEEHGGMVGKLSKHTPDQIVLRLEKVSQKSGVDVCRARILVL